MVVLTPPLPPPVEALAEALRCLDPGAAAAAGAAGGLNADDVLAAYHQLQLQQRAGLLSEPLVAGAGSLCSELLRGMAMPAGGTEQAAPVPAGGGRGARPEAAVRGGKRKRAVVVSPAGAAHRLDAEAYLLALRAEGWAVDLLSGTAGDEGLGPFLAERRPAAVVVVCALAKALPEAAQALWAAQRSGIRVMLAGPGFGSHADDLRPLRLGADGWAPDLAAGTEVLRGWAAAPCSSVAASGPPAEYLKLVEAIPFTLQAASMAGPPTADRQLLRSLIEHLEAAVVVDDGRILLEFLREWSVHPVQGTDGATMARLVDAIGAALPETLERSCVFIEDAKRHLQRVLPPDATRAAGPALLSPPVAVAGQRPPAGLGNEGRAFTDLLMLGAMACEARVALVSVQRGGRWNTLSYGAERGEQVGDPALLEFLSSRQELTEVGDLHVHPTLATSTLPRPPLDMRWLAGMALRDRDGVLSGVMCIMDRRRKELTKSQGRAVSAIVRQLEAHLEHWRRPSGAWSPSEQAAEVSPASTRLNERLAARRGSLDNGQQLLRSHEVASLFDVTERTVINWAASGKLPALRTIGGHLRFRGEDVASLLDGRSRAARSG